MWFWTDDEDLSVGQRTTATHFALEELSTTGSTEHLFVA